MIDLFFHAGLPGSFTDHLVRGGIQPETDIARNGITEKKYVLRYIADLPAQFTDVHYFQFYAVNEKKKEQLQGYEPTVSVTTKRMGDSVEIRVSDNGNGIPQRVVDKIFQPFFTTKPAGQGTGLGLSLSYDIITKGHGGELRVETEEGQGTTFIISVPAA